MGNHHREAPILKKLNRSIDQFCITHPNFGLPRLYLYLVIANAVVWLLMQVSTQSYGLMQFLAFSWRGLLHGQIWRLVSFALIPSTLGTFGFLLNCYCTYWIGAALERQWGTAKLTVYYLLGMGLSVAGSIAVSIITGYDVPLYGVGDISYAMFIAYALFYPDARIILIPIPIPIRARYLAYFDIALMVYEIFSYAAQGAWYLSVAPLMALINVFVFVWPELGSFLHLEKKRSQQATHFQNTVRTAQRVQQRAREEHAYTRKCAVCGRTDVSNPELDFRYCSQCAGYHCFCSDHIFSHVHFTDEFKGE